MQISAEVLTDIINPIFHLSRTVAPGYWDQPGSLWSLAHRMEREVLPTPPISVQFSCLVVSDSLRPHGLQHARPPCPSPTPGACSNSRPLRLWCHPTISSSVVPFSRLQSFPASGSFPVSQFFSSGAQSIGVSASACPLSHHLVWCISIRRTGSLGIEKRWVECENIRVDWPLIFNSREKTNQAVF